MQKESYLNESCFGYKHFLLRDANDNIVLATAIAAEAEAIMTGDLDLLVLQEYQGVAIVTARDFLDRYFPES